MSVKEVILRLLKKNNDEIKKIEEKEKEITDSFNKSIERLSLLL